MFWGTAFMASGLGLTSSRFTTAIPCNSADAWRSWSSLISPRSWAIFSTGVSVCRASSSIEASCPSSMNPKSTRMTPMVRTAGFSFFLGAGLGAGFAGWAPPGAAGLAACGFAGWPATGLAGCPGWAACGFTGWAAGLAGAAPGAAGLAGCPGWAGFFGSFGVGMAMFGEPRVVNGRYGRRLLRGH
jgi:hypothetical protein